ncbi:hypothetical protein PAHAL_4G145100 [Panicum hallii]|uniref:Uncharacterized protein n=1 Tax=Panicum hallii TaxID=206008 RepID=A0A2T8JCW4_9POAL|nr:hypothetical protein PAHAL_4G145100 [Panicum hallii]
MGLTLEWRMEEGKHSMSQERGEGTPPYSERDASPYGVKGSMYVVTLSALQRCLEDRPDTAERRPRSGFPTSRGTGDGHLEAHHDL